MSLVNQVLIGVSDTRLLTDHRVGPSPLQALIVAYSDKAAHNDRATNLTELSTGMDLKVGISKLDVEDQVQLLYQYLCSAKRIIDPAEVEERKLRRWAVKITISAMIVVTLTLVGAVTAIGVRSGAVPSNEVVSTFLEVSGEIVHLLWSGNID